MAEAFLNRPEIEASQLQQLRELVRAVRRANPFYRQKFSALPENLTSLAEFKNSFPLTAKAELVADQTAHPPYGTNLTCPIERYTRFHQTSGTTGAPLRWLDTPESWDWMVRNWLEVYAAAGVGPSDRIFFAFSFGPFIGFWLAFEAGTRIGALSFPGGGLSSVGRLRIILDNLVTVICCTPTYALRLAEIAAAENIDLSRSRVRLLIVAGEPGASIPATRKKIESSWPGARVFDHHGMTEVGPVTYECPERPGILHIMESSYVAEIVNPQTGLAVAAGQPGELLLTTLGRTGSPLIRYRTGDLVKAAVDSNIPCACGRHELSLEAGILGRGDDMLTIRGVNVYPTAVEGIIRQFKEIAEFQIRVSRAQALAELLVAIEPIPSADPQALVQRLEKEFQTALNLRVPVITLGPGSLPRFEMKAKRWVMS